MTPELPPIKFVRRRRQKYIRIRVKTDEVVVSAPFYCTQKEMHRFAEQKQDWIRECWTNLQHKLQQTKSQNRFDEGFLLFDGDWIPVDLSFGGNLCTFHIQNDRAEIQVGDREILEEITTKLYRRWATPVLKSRFHQIAIQTGFKYGNVSVRDQKTKWGSCSSRGNINLNWRLIKCPKFVQDYIFVHELCHLRHPNHSKDYWNLVDSITNLRKPADQWINENGSLVFENP